MPNLVVHDAALAAKREALAAAQSAAMVRPAGGYGATALSKPDPNAPAQRAERVRRLQFMVREREEERRRQRGEKVKPYNRKKNYYDRLGLPRDCSAAEVRRAFRRLSLLFHPDKQLGKSDEEVAAASVLFRELCEVRREAAALRQHSCKRHGSPSTALMGRGSGVLDMYARVRTHCHHRRTSAWRTSRRGASTTRCSPPRRVTCLLDTSEPPP